MDVSLNLEVCDFKIEADLNWEKYKEPEIQKLVGLFDFNGSQYSLFVQLQKPILGETLLVCTLIEPSIMNKATRDNCFESHNL